LQALCFLGAGFFTFTTDDFLAEEVEAANLTFFAVAGSNCSGGTLFLATISISSFCGLNKRKDPAAPWAPYKLKTKI
jgi:hypothetical protein